MPIYEYYCPDNHRIYQFFAKTVAQGQTVPKCPDNPAFRMEKIMSAFAITGGKPEEKGVGDAGSAGPADDAPGPGGGRPDGADDARMEAAFEQLEGEMDSVDENDPRAMGRMMRRMAELTGEKLDGSMEEVVRKLEEGTDPDKLEEQMDDAFPEGEEGAGGAGGAAGFPGLGGMGGARGRPTRDPNLYDY